MSRHHLILILFSVPFLFACKKEKVAFYANSTFQSSNIATVQPVRLFTKNGEITDTALIRKFVATYISALQGIPITDLFVFGSASETVNPYTSLKINFSDNNKATTERFPFISINFAQQMETHDAEFKVTADDEIMITEKDSVTIDESMSPNQCEILQKNSFTNYPSKSCTPMAVISGSPYLSCKFQNSYPLAIKENRLILPLIVLLIKSGRLSGPSADCATYINRNAWDYFNINVVSNLQTFDTIAVQEKEILLQKM